MMKKSSIAICLLLSSAVHAETYLDVHGLSKHFSAEQFNEVNTGVGITHYIQQDRSIMIGTYYNSIKQQSVYALYGWHYGPFSLHAGAVTGYNYPIVPAITPQVHIGPLTIGALPPVPGETPAVIYTYFSLRID